MFIANDAPDTPTNHRWRRYEKWFLTALTVFAVSRIVLNALSLSAQVHSSHKIVGLTSTFWTATSKADLHDGQLKSFRENLPLLSIGAVLFIVIKSKFFNQSELSKIRFYVLSGSLICVYLHGPGCVFLLLWAMGNYYVSEKTLKMRYYPVLLWVGNLGFLVLAEYTDGRWFQWLGAKTLVRGKQDSYRPPMPWFRCCNLCFLKVLSFLLDKRWASMDLPCPSKAVFSTQKHMEKCQICTEDVSCLKFRTESHASDYSFLSYFAYVFYFPLYLAGPIVSYNAWRSQVRTPQNTTSTHQIYTYALRLLFAMVLLELSIHFLYFPAIANSPWNRKIWEKFNAYELAIASYVILKWIWLKFVVIWRFFRLWAVCDGIDCPENMGRCMSNNYSLEGFWRMWHRAFNQWLVRYLFIPLGGAKYKVYNVWVVFGFVAIWHDLKLHLLVWGWGMCLFIVPELVAKAVIRQSRFAEFRKSYLYNWLCAVAGGFYIIIMMLANLVGFSFGLPGLYTIWEEILHGNGVSLLLQTWLLGTFVTLLMFAIRRDEGDSEPKY